MSQADMERRRDEVLALIRVVIHRLCRSPRRSGSGRVNCYLIDDDPLTLVDVGPNSGALAGRARGRAARARPPARGPRADRHHPPARRPPRAGRHPRRPLRRRGLRAGRARAGRRGLRRLRRPQRRARAGADAPPRHRAATWSRRSPRCRARYRGWGGSAPVTQRLRDGGELAFAGRTLRGPPPARATRRRTRCSSTPATASLIAGDHLIKHISSNPLIAAPLGRSASRSGRPRALMTYMASLRATREMPVDDRAARPRRARSATTPR